MQRHILFLFNFSFAKGVIYLTPLLIAAMAPATIYGAIEFGWAFALIAATLVVGAPLAGVNQRYLVKSDHAVRDELAVAAVIGCAVSFAGWGLCTYLGWSAPWAVAWASLGLAVLQNVLSTWFRMRGERNLTAWFDGSATIGAGIVVAGLLLFAPRATADGLGAAYAVSAMLILALGLAAYWRLREPSLRRRIKDSWRIGLPMLAGGLLAMWLGVGGRMIVGLIDESHVTPYSFMFRLAGLALGVHQLLGTALFARVYSARTRQADRILSPFLMVTATVLALIALSAPFLFWAVEFASLTEKDEAIVIVALPVVCIQVFYWIAFAMLQMRINRNGLAARALAPMFWVTILGASGIYGAAQSLDLDLIFICWGLALQSSTYFAIEAWVLASAKLPHKLVSQCALLGGSALSAIAVLNQLFRSGL